MNKNIKYIIITPVRNEERNIEKTIKSVIKQTIKPMRWMIVDDGSTDSTPEIITKYVEEYKWISLIRLVDRGFYDLMTGGEIKAFYKGYEKICSIEYDYLVKLDGDLSFNEYYFADIFHQFEKNQNLGIASGACYNYIGERLIMEKSYRFHVRGAARVYSKKCWDAIGGVIDNLGWDAIDVYKARMLGWDTYSFESIQIIHHVKTWTKGGVIHGKIRQGRVCYLMGMHPFFFFLKFLRLIFSKPYLIGSLFFSYGYLKSAILREKRVVDRDLMDYIRKEQLKRIFKPCISNITASVTRNI